MEPVSAAIMRRLSKLRGWSSRSPAARTPAVLVWAAIARAAPDVLLVDECLGPSDPAASAVADISELPAAGNVTIGGRAAISPEGGHYLRRTL
jgi:hypothetical protein